MNEFTIRSDVYPTCRTTIRVAPVENGPALIVSTGAAYIQTYATHEELVSLANMLLNYAQSLDYEVAA